MRATTGAVVCAALLGACGSEGGPDRTADSVSGHRSTADAADRRTGATTRIIPGVGSRLRGEIPARSRQVIAVYGKGEDSADATVVLYTKQGRTWHRTNSWPAHNGKRGWTTDHREGDKRSPTGVFTLTDAGGVLPDPGAKLPYTASGAFQASHTWPKSHWHDFDYVIAIDYNRVKGTSPTDPTRPEGQSKGGSIWLHMDHGSGTSGCVSLSKPGMAYLLRAIDPAMHPVVVMGDRPHLDAA
ncbi:L,D-transpeptidase family protein [Streptomyces sp. NPDC058045]|uniref:L,D-transpeptidase family protein n=1 Tax=Streptomyces sp. NPDC058045 TaxID=3346311 RepID=UPI0036E73DA4